MLALQYLVIIWLTTSVVSVVPLNTCYSATKVHVQDSSIDFTKLFIKARLNYILARLVAFELVWMQYYYVGKDM